MANHREAPVGFTVCAFYRVVVSLALVRPGRTKVLRYYPPHWWRSFKTVTLNPPENPLHSLRFLALAGPFFVWGIWEKTEESKMNREL